MSALTLVTYATRYGSTHEVAEAIAATLQKSDVVVEIQPMQEVRSLEGYHAVVMGAPIFIGKWHKEAHRFLARHQESLTQRPLALFALGPTSRDAQEMEGSRAQLDRDLEKYPWLKPATQAMFVGKYDPAALRFPDNLLAILPASPLHNMPARDERDWEAIRAWALSIADMMKETIA
ncbi:MAG: flavodoxin domain-containing protein [Anaerolineae bacterium]|nr:flavodoxin domain-containing protein [Anaerolineae bacterium]